MVRHPVFSIGLLLALASLLWPPLVVVAFGALDWVFVKAGQEVSLS
jgi:protein-S-isoprenylcysteine O-methyltransferase Ste14